MRYMINVLNFLHLYLYNNFQNINREYFVSLNFPIIFALKNAVKVRKEKKIFFFACDVTRIAL